MRASPAEVRLAASKRVERLVEMVGGKGRMVACVGDRGRRWGRASWELFLGVGKGFLKLQRRGWEGRG